MKTLSALAFFLRIKYAAGFGLYFAAAFFLCSDRRLFQVFTNEFYSAVLIAAAFLLFSVGAWLIPGRKSRFFLTGQFVFILLLNVLLIPVRGRHAALGTCFFLFCPLIIGWLTGWLRKNILFPRYFDLIGFGGAAAGFFVFWGLNTHAADSIRSFFPAAVLVLFCGIITGLLVWNIKTSAWKRTFLFACWLLLALQFVSFGEKLLFGTAWTASKLPQQEGGGLKPAAIAQICLQPNRKDLKVLLLGDSRDEIRQLSEFPLVRKLITISLRNGTNLFRRLNAESDDFDLIILQAPLPDSLYAERLYSIRFYQILKDRLSPSGVLAVWLPNEALFYRKTRILELYGTTGAALGNVFSVVKPAGSEPLVLLCGEHNTANLPEELNERANRLLTSSGYLPEGAFLMNTKDEQLEQERLFRSEIFHASSGQKDIQNTLMWNCIRSHPQADRTILGKMLDHLRGKTLPFLIILTVLFLMIRYFFSGGTARKRNWLTWENGLYNGLVILLLLIPYQQITGRLYRDWIVLGGIFLLTGFCGMLAAAGRHHAPLLLKLFMGLTLLLPFCGLAFLNGYIPEPLVFYALIGYAGYATGAIHGEIQGEMPVLLSGTAAGLLLGTLLYWLPGGLIFAVILAILVRIPPIAAENLQKQFDKPEKKV